VDLFLLSIDCQQGFSYCQPKPLAINKRSVKFGGMDKERTAREWFKMVENDGLRYKLGKMNFEEEESPLNTYPDFEEALFAMDWEKRRDIYHSTSLKNGDFTICDIPGRVCDTPPLKASNDSHITLIKKTILTVDSNF